MSKPHFLYCTKYTIAEQGYVRLLAAFSVVVGRRPDHCLRPKPHPFISAAGLSKWPGHEKERLEIAGLSPGNEDNAVSTLFHAHQPCFPSLVKR